MRFSFGGLVAAVVMAFGGSHAVASTLVDTGAGEARSGLILEGAPRPDVGWTQSWHAAQFSLAHASDVTGFDTWMTVVGELGAGGVLTAKIYNADAGLPVAGDELFSVDMYLERGEAFADWHGARGLAWSLDAGNYWLALEPSADSSFKGALWMQPGAPLQHYAMNIRGDWEWDPQGDTGPDQWAIRVFGEAAAIPEPATWTMMIIGFGMAGSMLRRTHGREVLARS